MTIRIHGFGIAGLILWFLAKKRGHTIVFSAQSFNEHEKSASMNSTALVELGYFEKYQELLDLLKLPQPEIYDNRLMIPFRAMALKLRDKVEISDSRGEFEIWATGWQIAKTPFDWLPLKSARGFMAYYHLEKTSAFHIESKKLTKIKKGNEIIVSGLNVWQNLETGPDQAEIDNFLTQVAIDFPELEKEKFEKLSYGIRPASYDRLPLVGFHPKLKNNVCLNGLGSLGFTRVWDAANMALELIEGKNFLEHPFRLERCFRKYLPSDLQ